MPCGHKEHFCGGGHHHRHRPSAFRAVSNAGQAAAANTPIKVLYRVQQFDLNNEYNPITSQFIPKSEGVYSIIASALFFPSVSGQDYRARIDIRVNGFSVTVVDNDFFGGDSPFGNVVSVSTILLLEAGDIVEVFAESEIAGTIAGDPSSTHFEAARIAKVK